MQLYWKQSQSFAYVLSFTVWLYKDRAGHTDHTACKLRPDASSRKVPSSAVEKHLWLNGRMAEPASKPAEAEQRDTRGPDRIFWAAGAAGGVY